MPELPAITTLHDLLSFHNIILEKLPSLKRFSQEAKISEQEYMEPETFGFYAGQATVLLSQRFGSQGRLTSDDITKTFEGLEDMWFEDSKGRDLHIVTGLLAIEMMYKDTFKEVLGLGRSRK